MYIEICRHHQQRNPTGYQPDGIQPEWLTADDWLLTEWPPLTDCPMVWRLRSRPVPPVHMVVLGSCVGRGGFMLGNGNPISQVYFKSFLVSIHLSSPLLPFLVQVPMLQHPPYKWKGVSLWSPHLISLPPVLLSTPVLSGNPNGQPNITMVPITLPPFTLRCYYLRLGLGSARKPGK